MRLTLICFALLLSSLAIAQDTPLRSAIIVKTNLTNVFVRRLNVSLEKGLTDRISLEAAWTSGKVRDFLLTDKYEFKGLLFRGKYFIYEPQFDNIAPYVGVYTGWFHRNLETNGIRFFPGRALSSGSIRSGITGGLAYYSPKRIVVDTQFSLGYGRYLNHGNMNSFAGGLGYLDLQAWVSVGYCF